MLRSILIPPKFKHLRHEFENRAFRLLDVGCGNHSPSQTIKYFPNCEYYDLLRNYNNDEKDFDVMTGQWEMDLTALKFDKIYNDFFDAIVMNHVIEHLYNGDKVLIGLIPKLRQGGIIYIEFPGFRSTKLPSMRGTLNFFDDSTHCRIWNLCELYNILLNNGCRILKGGTRRELLRILLTPVMMVYRILKYGHFFASDLWDLFGFAQFILARRLVT